VPRSGADFQRYAGLSGEWGRRSLKWSLGSPRVWSGGRANQLRASGRSEMVLVHAQTRCRSTRCTSRRYLLRVGDRHWVWRLHGLHSFANAQSSSRSCLSSFLLIGAVLLFLIACDLNGMMALTQLYISRESFSCPQLPLHLVGIFAVESGQR